MIYLFIGSSETCKQKQHKKILDKGKPDDVMPGILGIKEPLPSQPLSGMVNKHGGKVRLTFKLESDQVWIGKITTISDFHDLGIVVKNNQNIYKPWISKS